MPRAGVCRSICCAVRLCHSVRPKQAHRAAWGFAGACLAGGVGVVLTVSVWGVLTEFDDLSWTPEIEAASGQHGGCPEQSVGTVVAGFLRVVWLTPLTTRVILVL